MGVLDDFGRLGNFDRRRAMHPRGHHAFIHPRDDVEDGGGLAGDDFGDFGKGVFLVAGVDALGTVAAEEVLVELKAGMLFQHRYAIFFGTTGVNGGFINDDVALLEHIADRFAGLDEGREVGAFVFVDGCGDGDDVAVAGPQVVKVGGVAEMLGSGEFFLGGFQGEIVAGFKFGNATLVDVETDDGAFAAKFYCERKAYIAQADYCKIYF